MRDQHFFASVDKAQELLGWTPKFGLVDGLKVGRCWACGGRSEGVGGSGPSPTQLPTHPAWFWGRARIPRPPRSLGCPRRQPRNCIPLRLTPPPAAVW